MPPEEMLQKPPDCSKHCTHFHSFYSLSLLWHTISRSSSGLSDQYLNHNISSPLTVPCFLSLSMSVLQPVPAAALSRLAGSSSSPGGAGPAGDPFPGIVRLTEVKLQQAYQLLVRERHRSKQLSKQAREAASRVRPRSPSKSPSPLSSCIDWAVTFVPVCFVNYSGLVRKPL